MIRILRVFTVFMIAVTLFACASTASKRSVGEVLDDNVVAMKLRTKLAKDKIVNFGNMDIKVWKGIVTLTGSQANQEQIDRAIEVSEQQAGVKEVKAFLVLNELNTKQQDHASNTKGVRLWPIKKKTKGSNVNEVDLKPEPGSDNLDQNTSKIVKSKTTDSTKNVGSNSNNNDFQDIEY